MIPTILITWLKGNWQKLVMPLLGLLALLAAYIYGHHQATVSCHEAEYKSAYEHLEKQYKAQSKVVADLRSKQNQVQIRTETVTKEIPHVVKDNRACDLSTDALKLLDGNRRLLPSD